jgi:hypothetical protein
MRRPGAILSSDIPTTVAHSFAKTVESILTGWHFPEAGDVYFDSKMRDLVVAGKSRSAFGKGLRAITHAAFTLGLLAFCRARQTPHTGLCSLQDFHAQPGGSCLVLRLEGRFVSYDASGVGQTRPQALESLHLVR